MDEVEHLAHAGAETGAIDLLDGIGVEVGGDVGLVEGNGVVTAKKDLGHGVDAVAEMLALFFGAEVVETDAGFGVAVLVDGDALGPGELADDVNAVLGILEGDNPGRDDTIGA